MNSFSFSLQEMPSSVMPSSITADEFDGVLQDVEIPLDTLVRNFERRTALFSAIQNDAKKVSSRIQNLPKRVADPINSTREVIAARKLQLMM
ncbi:hypothetical protein COOONC_05403 [Cooperia oncophora]